MRTDLVNQSMKGLVAGQYLSLQTAANPPVLLEDSALGRMAAWTPMPI